MRQIIVRMMEEGKNSLRLMALFSLQLVKVLTKNPDILPLYGDVYLQMLLYSSWPCDQPEATCQVTDFIPAKLQLKIVDGPL